MLMVTSSDQHINGELCSEKRADCLNECMKRERESSERERECVGGGKWNLNGRGEDAICLYIRKE